MVLGALAGVGANCRDTAVVVASELATNAVVHAGTTYAVELYVGDPVRIEVTDSGPPAPLFVLPVRRRRPQGDGGWGLAIVAGLASKWGVDWLEGGKIVWAEVALEAPV
jgi:anti-sigma regulatory factor (Ser/Thr protein kinase)